MRVLLDTNAFLRWMAATPMPQPVERILAKRDTECLVSIVSGWEIMLKAKLGLSATDVEAGLDAMGARLLPIRFRHLSELSRLVLDEDHRDPFDRMLIAQALAEQLPVITSDSRFEKYRGLRVIWN